MRRKLKPLYLLLQKIALRSAGLFIGRAQNAPGKDEIKNILIIRIDRIGDLVLTSALVDALREYYPGAEVSILAGPYAAELVECMPGAAGAVVYDNKGAHRRWGDRRNFAKGLRGRFDLVVDPLADYTLETALLCFWSGARYRLGFDVAGRGVFFNLKEKPRAGVHFVDMTLGLLKALGHEPADGRTAVLKAPEEATAKAAARLKELCTGEGRKHIGIHPGGNYPSQRWLPERFAAAADELALKEGAEIILFGGPADRPIVEEISRRMQQAPAVWDGDGIARLAGAISQCDLLICNNSGPLHLAAALGVPTVSTMGPTVPHMWWPRGECNTVLRLALPCSPCGLGQCDGHECMRGIEVQEVVEAARNLLHRCAGGKEQGRQSPAG